MTKTNANKTKQCFLELLNPHKDLLYKYCKHIIWNANDTEDALQTTIMNAYKAFDIFEEESNFKAWIFKFLINTVLNFNKKYSRLLSNETHLEETQYKESLVRSRHEYPDVLEILERENIYHKILRNPYEILENLDKPVKDSLNALTPSEKNVFLLKSLADFSYKEIAGVLESPIGTVMSHLCRARAKLRVSLCDYARENGLIRDKDIYE